MIRKPESLVAVHTHTHSVSILQKNKSYGGENKAPKRSRNSNDIYSKSRKQSRNKTMPKY